MPDYVQVGNEITAGMMWPNGYVSGNNNAAWANFGQLLKAGINGIRDAAGANPPKIIIHIDRGGDWATTQWFFDNLKIQQVPVDIIGLSYYPFFHGPPDALAQCLTNAAARYGKPVLVAETAFPWTNSVFTTNIYGYAGTTNGQVRYAVDLTRMVENVPGGLGAGIDWWGAEYQAVHGVNEAGYNTTSFFGPGGNVLPVIDVFGQMTAPLLLAGSLSGPSLTLQWPLSATRAALATSTNLSPLSEWTVVTNASAFSMAGYMVTLPVNPAAASFYCLQTNN